ncbi:MAG: hypothetical protein EBU01_15865, partial [Crocinitomicaceae bacterium]|nr:hypothetical protein [Crocinitomicaceae bacterium]
IVMIQIVLSCSNITNKDKINNVKGKKVEGVHAAFYNSSGDRISMSTTEGRVIITDSLLNIILIRKIHSGNANSSFFSLDDKYIISGGNDNLLTVINSEDLSIIKKYKFHLNAWTSVYGYNTLAGCGNDGQLVVYNFLTTDTIYVKLNKSGAFHLFYTEPDKKLVVSSGNCGFEYDIQKKRIIHEYIGHRDWVYCIMPSNDMNKIITASKDSTVAIYDRFTQKRIYTSFKLDGAAYVACFSNDDKTIALSTSKGSIYFLDITLSKIIKKINAFKGRINTIHFSPSGTHILAGSELGNAKIFSVKTGKLLYECDY